MDLNIAVIEGDGIGPDIIAPAVRALNKIGKTYRHRFEFTKVLAGGCSIDRYGIPLTDNALEICKKSDSVLLGAVGGPKWDNLPVEKRPEKALLKLRSELGLFANLRPAVLYKQLKSACPLKPEIIGDGLDILVVRELTGGIYFGEKGGGNETAYDTMTYSKPEVTRVARVAFESAMKRGKKICSVDKANVLASSQIWRQTVEETAKSYPEVALSHMFVDNAAMQLIWDPKQFDVILTGNMFGDILSDEASMITGSIGMLPSASLGETSRGMYEPVHGSAPDIAGMDIANPVAMIISASMMLVYSFGLSREADAIQKAVDETLDAGYRTKDIMSTGHTLVGTRKMGTLIVERI